MSCLSGCLLFIDGLVSVLFFLIFRFLGLQSIARIGALFISSPIWIWLIKSGIRYAKKASREAELERERRRYEEELERERRRYEEELERDRQERERERQREEAELERERQERERERQREIDRRNTACLFRDGITKLEFEEIARRSAKRIKRLRIDVDAPIIYCEVDSQSGISTWEFTLDFNDFGHITGTCWITKRGNYDSSIPDRYAELMQDAIEDKLKN